MQKISKFILVFVVVLLVGAYFIFFSGKGDIDREPIVLDGDMIDFAEVGNVTLDGDTFVLVYEAPGQPALTRDLRFDSVSRCLIEGEARSCEEIDLAETPSEQRVTVEGVETDGVLVRKLTVLREGEEPRLPELGSVMIDWDLAVRVIENCEVEGVTQTHALDVYLNMKDGTRLRTVSPQIDDIFEITSEVQESCGDMWVATE